MGDRQDAASRRTGERRRLLAALAALLALGLGIAHALRPPADGLREPRWAAALAPLAEAPLEAGSVVGLLLPAGPRGDAAQPLLFEAVWQRPDLRWALAGSPAAEAATYLVALPGVAWPPGSRVVWRKGAVSVLEPGAT